MRPLRIAIDASRTTMARTTGTEYYALELIRHHIQLNDQQEQPHQFMLYFRDKPPDDLFITSKYVTRKVIPFPRAWTHLRFAAELWRDRPDVTFIPAHTLPISFPGRAVVTVHDLGFKVYPEAHPVKQRLYLDWTTRYSAARATLILADSQATAHDLRCYYGTPQAKIRVVYPAINPPRSGVLGATRRKYNLPEDYFLFVGTLQPRKNIARIVEAFARWKAAHPDSTVGLVLAGQKGWLYDEAWLNGVENVYLPGYIDEADKAPLYMGAIALVFPSLYEGFGFPVLEAMHCGTPVIASNTSSLPELVGQGGLLVNPLDVNEIMVAMDLLTRNKELHWAIRSKGYMQAAQFTWHTAAQQTMAVLEEAAG